MKTDIELQKDVMDELQWDPVLQAAEIGVVVKNGIVTLMGHVNNYSEKTAAEKAAKRVKDVKAVAMDLEIRLPSEHLRSDADIAAAALNALKWSSFVPEDRIRLKVDDAWITLEGEVEWQFQKESAYRAVRDLIGVRGVVSHISVRPRITPILVKDVIKKALERSAEIEADGINIITDGGRIVLRGKVRSWGERNEVERAVWATPGVTEVKDELIIAP
ncbi:BON domain-containing protein [Chitinophaga japonensis]|uniref:Osmotically-inducible protein OsmY n=1 Tax=Chitinophaga japonensis TaxID=104662 RepID=A0A562SSM1_CHIJA|nr:BON domain-containing protein [Chitinophaga japonensis]TWI84133.1 osmotically-inducible protein OsmY [Chitinophaga japonensis]